MSARSTPSAWHRRDTIFNWLSLLVLLSLGCALARSDAVAPYAEPSGTFLMRPSIDASPVEALQVSSSFRAQATAPKHPPTASSRVTHTRRRLQKGHNELVAPDAQLIPCS